MRRMVGQRRKQSQANHPFGDAPEYLEYIESFFGQRATQTVRFRDEPSWILRAR